MKRVKQLHGDIDESCGRMWLAIMVSTNKYKDIIGKLVGVYAMEGEQVRYLREAFSTCNHMA